MEEAVVVEEEDDNTSTTTTTDPTNPTTTAPPEIDPRDQPLPLAGCSHSGPTRPAVILNEFFIYLTTTYDDAPNQVPSQDFVQITFDHLWEEIGSISGVAGYSFSYDFVRGIRNTRTRMRMLRRVEGGDVDLGALDDKKVKDEEEEEEEKGTGTTGSSAFHLRHNTNTDTTANANRKNNHENMPRRLQRSNFNARIEGCIDLRDNVAVTPSYNDVQAAIVTAFSGANLDGWLQRANGADFRVTSVRVLDGDGEEIDTTVP